MSEEILPYPAFDEETGRIHCQICGNKYLVISPKHLMKHDISHADYTKRYPTAPLSSKEFNVKSKYGKVKDLFAPTEPDELEEVIVNEEPNIEDDIDIEKILKEKSYRDPVKQSKAQVLDTLRSFFTNVRQDYMIEEYGKRSGRMKYQFITDFTDPILRIVIQFPNTFWHNRDVHIDLTKHYKLKEDGWKILVVKSRSPSRKDIQEVVDEM
jgi:hypothetical protein